MRKDMEYENEKLTDKITELEGTIEEMKENQHE